jgi:GTP diphosphokinase / guanosine-3',5'-bis(diphosphate) 3'-diphosphatase
MAEIKEILSLMDNPSDKDKDLVKRAYIFSEKAHKNHLRLSGEPYFSHLSETAKILAEYGMGASTVAAGLLHDTIEDTGTAPKLIESEFNSEILFLVEGVTKLGKLQYHGADRHNESLRKLFVAMSQDIRVLMIKLADRLHNMRTLIHVPVEKRKRIASETLEIYAPIAYRLGIRKLSRELEDLSFPYVYPKEYEKLQKEVKNQHEENLQSLEKFLKSLKKTLAKEGVTYIRTEYRVKGLFSLYKKLQGKKRHLEEVTDILALRVIVPTVSDCYQALGVIHGTYRPLPGRIKDYIAFPKPNGYQALHTTVFTGDGNVVEVQIKTEEMYLHSEYGIASHISYKEGNKKGANGENFSWLRQLLPKQNFKEVIDWESVPIFSSKFEDIPHWIKDLVKHQGNVTDNKKLKEDLRSDFFQYRIFVFTPEGDVVDLPKDSTPVDFAYSIHSDIGNHMSGAKVNGKLVSLDTVLLGGDVVEIVTRPNSRPTEKWLEYARTTGAKRHIRIAVQKNRKW